MNKPRQRTSVVQQSNFEATSRRHIGTPKFSVELDMKRLDWPPYWYAHLLYS